MKKLVITRSLKSVPRSQSVKKLRKSQEREEKEGIDFVFFFKVSHWSAGFLYCFDKGVEFYLNKKYKFAVSIFQKGLTIDKSNTFALNNLAVCLFKTNKIGEAVQTLNQINSTQKTDFAYYNLAVLNLLINKFSKVFSYLSLAEPLFPSFSGKFKNLFKALNLLQPKTSKSETKDSIIPNDMISKSMIFSKRVIDDLNHSFSEVIHSAEHLEKDDILEAKTQTPGIEKEIQESLEASLRPDSVFITEEDIKFLFKEYQKKIVTRDYPKIDSVLKALAFFQQFNEETRQFIYSISQIEKLSPAETIFKQGDLGGVMYVIVKGSVSVIKKVPEYGNKDIAIATLYDGKHFGELALLNALDSNLYNKERSASCITCEETVLLSIPQGKLAEVVLSQNKEVLEEKISFLSNSFFFQGVSKKDLIPLALNIEKKLFKMNEIVLKKGEIPKGLFIIKKGFVDIVSEQEARKQDLSKCVIKTVVVSLKEFDCFATRAVKSEQKVYPAKYSAVVQSSVCEVLVITTFHLQFLTQPMLSRFLTIVNKMKDPDCPDELVSLKLKKMLSGWENYKSGLLQNIHKDRLVARSKLNYPYIW